MRNTDRRLLRVLPWLFVTLAALVLANARPWARLAAPPLPHPSPPAPPTGDGRLRLVDVAARAGLHYRWSIAGPRPLDILQTIGNGCAFLDFDNDGALDVLLVGPTLALFQGDGRGHFTEATRAAGLSELSGHFLGCAVGDYDNDGRDDIYVSGHRTGLLLHNDGGGRFTDSTRSARLAPQSWGTSCAWGDVDGDGRLDLYVGNYVEFDAKTDRRLCRIDVGVLGSCRPGEYRAAHGALYRNEGGGRFRDVTLVWGAGERGKTLGVAFADYDGSGRASLYLGNDTVLGELLHNEGMTFRDVGTRSGATLRGADMGVDWGDYDNDGRYDLGVGTFISERKYVYHNLGDGLFQDVSTPLGINGVAVEMVTFGLKWLDADNDGWLDLMLANGHVLDNIEAVDRTMPYRQPTLLFHNVKGTRLLPEGNSAGPDLSRPLVGRGLATGDFDNDGRMDALVVDSEGTPLLLRNESPHPGHWLSLRLVGTRSNRDGYGARVTVTAGGLTQTRACHADGSYLSSSDKRVHVGLGEARSVQSLRVRWPSGHVDSFRDLPTDRFLTIQEGAPGARPEPHHHART